MEVALHSISACLVCFYKGVRGLEIWGFGTSSEKNYRLAIARHNPPPILQITFLPTFTGWPKNWHHFCTP